MNLTDNGIEKANAYLQKNNKNPYCTDCSKEMILQKKLFEAIDFEVLPNGPKGHSYHCQFNCEKCNDTRILQITEFGLEKNLDYTVS